MGSKPSTAARTTDAVPAASGSELASIVRFQMPHAFVIVAFVVTAAVLASLGMGVRDALLLIGGAGTMGAAVVLVVIAGGRSGSRLGRALRAFLGSSN